MSNNRYARQAAFFGKDGQVKIEATKVAIVGLGGLGSHVAQQLAYLGVQDFVLIDNDIVDDTNLNRLIGAVPGTEGSLKVDIAAHMISAIQPEAKIQLAPESIRSPAIQLLIDRDIVFGCVDRDDARAALLGAACEFSVPYIDISTEIFQDQTFGGHVIFTGVSKGCLMCRGLIDQEEVRINTETHEQKAERARIYGVSIGDLDGSGPSVVMLNGLLASAAVLEFVAHITGLREPVPVLTYRSAIKSFTKSEEGWSPDCYFCEYVFNNQGKIDLAVYY